MSIIGEDLPRGRLLGIQEEKGMKTRANNLEHDSEDGREILVCLLCLAGLSFFLAVVSWCNGCVVEVKVSRAVFFSA